MEKVRIAISKNHFYTKVTGYETTNQFNVMELEYQHTAEYIKLGHAITNVFDNSGKFHRKKEYFVSADFFALDFDNKEEMITKGIHSYFSLNELLKGATERASFIMNNAFLIYTTQSHAEYQNKFRALFHLPEQIKTVAGYERIINAFLAKFPEADTNCKDAARFFYGAGTNSIVKIVDNRLSQTTINSVIQLSEKKKEKRNEFGVPAQGPGIDFHANPNSIIEEEMLKLAAAPNGDRNTSFNRACFVISSLVSRMQKQGFNPDVIQIIRNLKNTAKEIGLEEVEIENTFNSGWNAGKVIRHKIVEPTENSLKRTHANKPIPGNLQMNKTVLDHFPDAKTIDTQWKTNAVKTQIGFFKTFKVDFQGTITEQILDNFLNEIDSMKFLLCYFSLWKYAHNIGTTSFNNVNLNDIIAYSSTNNLNHKSLYKERNRIIEIIKTLGLVSIIRQSKSKDKDIISDYEIIHLINDLSIISEKGKTYISCELPKKQGDIGAYIPDRIFEISIQDKGSFFLAVALMKEINRICISKKVGINNYERPAFENKPISWTRKQLILMSRLENTDKINKSEANKSLRKKLQKLMELDILQSFSEVPLDDKEKVTIVISNP